MNAKKYLLQIKKINSIIKNKECEIEHLNEIALSITTALKDVAVQTSGGGDKIGDCATKIVDLQNELKNDISKYFEIKKEILNNITKLDVDEYNVLYKRYFEFKKFEKIADEMFYSRQTIYLIHKRALNNLEKVLKK